MSFKLVSPHGLAQFAVQQQQWLGVDLHCVTQNIFAKKSWQSFASDQATVSVILRQGGAGFCEPRKRINAPLARTRYDAGHSLYIPPHAEIWGFGDSTSLVCDLRARFQLPAVEAMLGDQFDRHKWSEPVLLVYDERVRKIAALLWDECHAPAGGSSLCGESLTTALMASFFTASRTVQESSQRGLSRPMLKRILDYMEANLAREMHLDELAAVVDLSCSHFGRGFKASLGVSPHQWLMQRRIALAQELLLRRENIAVAAQMAGFANQSHFTRIFRTITGTTPRRWLDQAD
ncbi:helix-turn-helix domain-containing protein [Silvibacterium acidisoli]|uniref:helix-turn-helix domain-containing protein n=1 Tax=Acidobacteriaceae bacterium ZG23-2 TaxID=2883246 RepID=UPI00406C44AD